HCRPLSYLFPYTTLFRSKSDGVNSIYKEFSLAEHFKTLLENGAAFPENILEALDSDDPDLKSLRSDAQGALRDLCHYHIHLVPRDRKSTRLNSSHVKISY